MTEVTPRTRMVLRDILSFADAAGRLVARGHDAYTHDETLRLAAEALLHKIGEAVGRLPQEFTDAHPGVPWRAMKATRHLVAHEYDQIDYEIIWNALVARLPASAEIIRVIVQR